MDEATFPLSELRVFSRSLIRQQCVGRHAIRYRRKVISGVYALTCRATGEARIGSSHDIVARLRWHRTELRGGVHPTAALQAAYTKYGEDGLYATILELCSEEECERREQMWLDKERPAFNIRRDAVSKRSAPVREFRQRQAERLVQRVAAQ
jgi:group I intron endonuclease